MGNLINVELMGGSKAPCAVCGDSTPKRFVLDNDGHVPICSTFCEHAWPNVSKLREALIEARRDIAAIRNQRATVNATDACDGDWDRCWCDDCEKRRLLKASGKAWTSYEVYNLTLAQVKEYLATPTGGTEP